MKGKGYWMNNKFTAVRLIKEAGNQFFLNSKNLLLAGITMITAVWL